jgi:N-sulfoglucosamine sulfohydrolase
MTGAKPNIVLFVTDDQSPIAGCYGSPIIQTPHLDALAKEGTRFTRAYATTASCSASRSVILTGLHNHANGQFGHTHDYHKFETFRSCATLSLPLQLKSLGYRTAHIGKLHVAPEAVYRFDQYLPTPGGGHNTPKWIDACKPLFAEKTSEPFFLCFWTTDPHRSGDVESTAAETLKPNRFGNPPRARNTQARLKSPMIPPPFRSPLSFPTRRNAAASWRSTIKASPAPTRPSVPWSPRSRKPASMTTP